VKGLRAAWGFLTTLPLGDRSSGPAGVGQAAGWLPVVGLLLGAILAAVWLLAGTLFPRGLAAAVVVAVWAAMTGALHLDGVADCCDGLLGPHTRERRLEILDDPRTGAFGVVGITLVLLLKTLSIASLHHPGTLLLAPMLGRLAILLLAVRRPARESGMAWEFHRGLRRRGILVAVLMAALVSGFCAFLGLISFASAVLVAMIVGLLAARRLGGVTGDVLGLGCELAELVVLMLGAVGYP
jgi:adenosylcobinamide-GDP ribazoletransferase